MIRNLILDRKNGSHCTSILPQAIFRFNRWRYMAEGHMKRRRVCYHIGPDCAAAGKNRLAKLVKFGSKSLMRVGFGIAKYVMSRSNVE
jgi:hypothetical protein